MKISCKIIIGLYSVSLINAHQQDLNWNPQQYDTQEKHYYATPYSHLQKQKQADHVYEYDDAPSVAPAPALSGYDNPTFITCVVSNTEEPDVMEKHSKSASYENSEVPALAVTSNPLCETLKHFRSGSDSTSRNLFKGSHPTSSNKMYLPAPQKPYVPTSSTAPLSAYTQTPHPSSHSPQLPARTSPRSSPKHTRSDAKPAVQLSHDEPGARTTSVSFLEGNTLFRRPKDAPAPLVISPSNSTETDDITLKLDPNMVITHLNKDGINIIIVNSSSSTPEKKSFMTRFRNLFKRK